MRRPRLPSLNALRAFEAAGRLGKMTLAAEELGVTHGAVSRQVRELEEGLGLRLFAGPKSGLFLTEAGRALLAGLTPAFEQIGAAVASVSDESEGTLDVSCLATFTMRWLIPRLYTFQADHPGIEVRLSASDAPIDFTRERYEVAIRVDDHPLPEEAETTPLFPEFIGVVLAPGLAARERLLRPEDLARVAGLRTRTRPSAWAAWARRMDLAPAVPLIGREFEHFYFMLEAATAGLGACVAPWPLVMDDVRAGRLVAPFGFVPSGLTYVAVRRRRRNQRAERFCAWLAAQAGETALPGAPVGSSAVS
jgi:DNA-binding transcriptional LysR family regulator